MAETKDRLEVLLRRLEVDLVRLEAVLDRLSEIPVSVGLDAQKEIDAFIARYRTNPTIEEEV